MRLCRFAHNDTTQIGFYEDDFVIPLQRAAEELGSFVEDSDAILSYLPGGEHHEAVRGLETALANRLDEERFPLQIPVEEVKLLVPIPAPSKLMLLAGNYSKHIEEGGGRAEERAKTFPYVFMKPPLTTLTNPGDPVVIPSNSPDEIDWELELGVVIGKQCRRVSEADALDYVAGYTVINDISDRNFTPNPDRNERPKDGFFDWLHGKWHDTFCPCGPCVTPASDITDPQQLPMRLLVNGETEQDSSTAEMVFPVAAIVEFVSSIVTLEPGDIISTGTPDGVGKAKGKFLKAGDTLEAIIEGIGVLRNPVTAE